jgi:hypothetical protein
MSGHSVCKFLSFAKGIRGASKNIKPEEKFLEGDIIFSLMKNSQNLLGTSCGINRKSPKEGKGFTIYSNARKGLIKNLKE